MVSWQERIFCNRVASTSRKTHRSMQGLDITSTWIVLYEDWLTANYPTIMNVDHIMITPVITIYLTDSMKLRHNFNVQVVWTELHRYSIMSEEFICKTWQILSDKRCIKIVWTHHSEGYILVFNVKIFLSKPYNEHYR